jgi:hypothetical protein
MICRKLVFLQSNSIHFAQGNAPNIGLKINIEKLFDISYQFYVIQLTTKNDQLACLILEYQKLLAKFLNQTEFFVSIAAKCVILCFFLMVQPLSF